MNEFKDNDLRNRRLKAEFNEKLKIFLFGIVIGMLIFVVLLRLGIIQYCNFENVIPKGLC